MKKLAIGVSLLIAAFASISTSFAQYQVGSEAWLGDECLYVVSEGWQWQPTNYCRVRQSELVWDLYDRSVPQNLLMTVDWSYPAWAVVYVRVSPLTLLVPNRNSIVHLLDGDRASMWIGANGQWYNVAALLAAQGAFVPNGDPNVITIGGGGNPLDPVIRQMYDRLTALCSSGRLACSAINPG